MLMFIMKNVKHFHLCSGEFGKMNAIRVLTPRVVAGVKRELVPRSYKFAEYFRKEIAPPKPEDWPAIKAGFNQLAMSYRNQKWRELTVRQAALNALVGIEVIMWFWAGEVIGRWNLYGYVIPWTVKHPND